MSNRFVFISPMYNASRHVGQMLSSVISQSYDNWQVILIDDVSSDSEAAESKRTIEGYQSLLRNTNRDPSRIRVVWNRDTRGKQWEVSNVLHGISMCDDEDIICRLDADDWLTDLDGLSIINYFYEREKCDALWTAHRWGFSDKNISGPMPDSADPYRHPWVSSHLKTFRKYLLNNVKDENYRGEDGNYIKRAGDQAIYLPAIKNAKKRVFLPRVMYHYTIEDVPETYSTPDAAFQRDEAIYLRERGFIS